MHELMPTSADRRVTSLIEELLPSLIRIRHELHENPGILYQEIHANQVVQRELSKASIQGKPPSQ